MVSLRAELAKENSDDWGVQRWNKKKQGGWGNRPARGKGRYLCPLYNSNHSILFPVLDLTILDPHSRCFCLPRR